MNKSVYWKAILKKDIQMLINNKAMLASIILIGVLFSLIYPILNIIMLTVPGLTEGSEGLSFMDSSVMGLMLPIMLGNILGTSLFVSEKENKTLETLLYSPLTTKQLVKTKLFAPLIPCLILHFCVFFLSIIANYATYYVITSELMPFNILPFISNIIFGTATLFMVLVFSVNNSIKADNAMEAQQKSGVALIPLMLGVLFTSGIINASPLFIESQSVILPIILYLICSALFFLIGYLILRKIFNKFTSEKLLNSSSID